MEASYRFFQNDKCEYFPCHKIEEGQDFNCLFCYCPLYSMGDRCGGNYIYLENGVKSCEKCLLPHLPQNYDLIEQRLRENSDGKNDFNNDINNDLNNDGNSDFNNDGNNDLKNDFNNDLNSEA